jgi:2-polyprenyl-3-methyl-5-hydroxy-6-metoxy-1,4-benzoquinol methylase
MTKITDNYKKHTAKNPLQRFLLNNFLKTLVEEAKRLYPETVLDVGCGEGFVLDRLHQEGIGKKLEGVDILDRAIEIGRKLHPHLTLKQGSIYNLPYKDNSFDLVICSEVLEHLDDPEKALREVIRVSKGYCLLSVPNEPLFMLGNFLRGKNLSRFGNDIEHIQHWSNGAFYTFVDKHIEVIVNRQPLPWTLLVAEKRKN